MTPDLSLPPIRSLVFCCCHWSSAIKYSSYFWKKSFRLYSTIDRPLINPQWSWSSDVYCRFISISNPISITPTDLVPGLLLLSLVFCYQIFLWFSKISLHLHFTIYRLLINTQLPWFSAVDCRLIRIVDPRSIDPTDPVPGLLLSSLVFCYQIFLWFSKKILALALHHW